MKLLKVKYSELNSRQKEIYNFQKVSGLLADYGFNCLKLSDDWQGADFLAYHKDGEDTLKIQLKGRLTISKKYRNKELYMAFPIKGDWHLIKHDGLIELVKSNTNWMNTKSWKEDGEYHSANPNNDLKIALKEFQL